MSLRRCFLFILFVSSQIVYGQAVFNNITEASGIWHTCRTATLLGGGATLVDLNNDGWLDIVVTGGTDPDKFYINQKDLSFIETSQFHFYRSNKLFTTTSVIHADFNNDGCQDIFFTTAESDERNILLRGDCTGDVTNISAVSGINNEANCMGAVVIDYNLDGLLDLYLLNYIEESVFIRDADGKVVGFDHVCAKNVLYRNLGEFNFRDVTDSLNIAGQGCTLAALATYIDNKATIHTANDFGEWVHPDELFVQMEEAQAFVDQSVQQGVDVGHYGMGIAIGDPDKDGDYDWYVTNIGDNASLEQTSFNRYNRLNVEATDGQDSAGFNKTGWSAFYFDYDNDTDEDLFVANGQVPSAEFLNVTEEDRSSLYKNDGAGNLSLATGETQIRTSSRNRGAVFGDLDNDGDLDVLQCTVSIYEDDFGSEKAYQLFENTTDNGHHYLQLTLRGMEDNRNAYGSEVTVYRANSTQSRLLYSGGVHTSQSALRLHFGLGTEDSEIDSLMIEWPNGEVQRIHDLPIDQHLWITQGESDYEIFGCTDPNSMDYSDLATLSIDCREFNTNTLELQSNKVSVSPNPSSGKVIIGVDSGSRVHSIKVLTMDAIQVYPQKINILRNSITMDASSLPAGMYLLHVIDESGQRFVKKWLKH